MLLYVTYGADVIAPIGTLCWLHRCYVHYLWHICYCALCTAQMLLCPFHVIYCEHRCYCALFMAKMLLSHFFVYFVEPLFHFQFWDAE